MDGLIETVACPQSIALLGGETGVIHRVGIASGSCGDDHEGQGRHQPDHRDQEEETADDQTPHGLEIHRRSTPTTTSVIG